MNTVPMKPIFIHINEFGITYSMIFLAG